MQTPPDPLRGIDTDSGTTSLPKLQQTRRGLLPWLKSHRTRIIIAVGLLLIGGWAVAAWWWYQSTAPVFTEAPDIAIAERPVHYYSPLTGVEVTDEATTKLPVTAIMIENSPDARPHSGLKQAGIVYEAIAEGGITRYAAIYQEDKPTLIGPVRSLRPYFLDWIAAYDASVVHVGGSARALTEVRNGTYRDLDQFFNGSSFWRANDRYAPHNVYTSFEKLDALEKSKGYTSSSFTGWERQDGKATETPDATTVKINFSSALYNTYYTYDATTNTYARFLGGVKHLDREKGQITPSVIIAMMVDEKTVQEDGSREDITTTGNGKAYIFQNGTVVEATWRKTATKSQIQWLDSEGNSIVLNRGQTWVAAVPNRGGSVSW